MIISIQMNSNFFKCKYTCNASKLSLGWKVWQRKVVADKKYASTTRKCGTKAQTQTQTQTKTKTQAPADREREKKVGGSVKKFSSNSEGKFTQASWHCCFCSPGTLSISRSRFKTYIYVCAKQIADGTGQTISISQQPVVDVGWLKSVCAAGFGLLFTQILLKSFPPTGNWQIDRHDCEHNGQVSHYWQNLFVGLNWLVVEWMARIIQLFKFSLVETSFVNKVFNKNALLTR